MSDFRFGSNDYRLNIDWEHQEPDFCFGWDAVDWNRVEWVEIDSVKYIKELTCQMVEEEWASADGKDTFKRLVCSNCGDEMELSLCSTGIEDDHLYYDYSHCAECGAKVVI